MSSLMVDGGLQMALTAAIKVEVQDLEDTCFEKESEQVNFILFKSSPLSPRHSRHFLL